MVAAWLMLSLLGADGCTKDADCNGGWSCEAGSCVPPAPPPMPEPEPEPEPSYMPKPQRTGLMDPASKALEAERPSVEFGWLALEACVGILASASITILPYYLMFSSGQFGDQTMASVLFTLTFVAGSAASAGLQLSVAVRSRNYRPLAAPPFLVGFLGMGAVLGLYYATGWLPTGRFSGGIPNGGSAGLLMVGSIVIVPLLQTAALNIFKRARGAPTVLTLGDPVARHGVAFLPPTIAPVVLPGVGGTTLGAQVSLLAGNF